MSQIPDFTESELWIIKTTLKERYGEPLEPMLADTELRLSPYSSELSVCPATYWEKDGCHFVVCKTGYQHYRCQFYYRGHEMFSPDIEEFDDLSECMVTLLQVQADHTVNREDADTGSS
jgi:hypothetical protein